jgi:hypothetical protein
VAAASARYAAVAAVALCLAACGRDESPAPETAGAKAAPTPVAEPVAPMPAAEAVAPCEAGSDHWIDWPVRAAHVRAEVGARIHFEREGEGCPGGTDCRSGAYLVPGDAVLVGPDRGGWACAWYATPKDDGTSGYLPIAALAFDPIPDPTPADWFGTWTRGNDDVPDDPEATTSSATIEFQETAEGMAAAGSATWIGPHVDDAGNRSIHEGAFDGALLLAGAVGSIGDEESCHVEFRLVGDVLLVRDNGMCGGAGTTFQGRYRRRSDLSEATP